MGNESFMAAHSSVLLITLGSQIYAVTAGIHFNKNATEDGAFATYATSIKIFTVCNAVVYLLMAFIMN